MLGEIKTHLDSIIEQCEIKIIGSIQNPNNLEKFIASYDSIYQNSSLKNEADTSQFENLLKKWHVEINQFFKTIEAADDFDIIELKMKKDREDINTVSYSRYL